MLLVKTAPPTTAHAAAHPDNPMAGLQPLSPSCLPFISSCKWFFLTEALSLIKDNMGFQSKEAWWLIKPLHLSQSFILIISVLICNTWKQLTALFICCHYVLEPELIACQNQKKTLLIPLGAKSWGTYKDKWLQRIKHFHSHLVGVITRFRLVRGISGHSLSHVFGPRYSEFENFSSSWKKNHL